MEKTLKLNVNVRVASVKRDCLLGALDNIQFVRCCNVRRETTASTASKQSAGLAEHYSYNLHEHVHRGRQRLLTRIVPSMKGLHLYYISMRSNQQTFYSKSTYYLSIH